MIKYNLQYFGGRGASGTLKKPNGKIAKKKNTLDDNTRKLKDSLMAEYGKDTVQRYLDGKMTSIQLADEIGNSGADLVENLKRQMDRANNVSYAGYKVGDTVEYTINEYGSEYGGKKDRSVQTGKVIEVHSDHAIVEVNGTKLWLEKDFNDDMFKKKKR